MIQLKNKRSKPLSRVYDFIQFVNLTRVMMKIVTTLNYLEDMTVMALM